MHMQMPRRRRVSSLAALALVYGGDSAPALANQGGRQDRALTSFWTMTETDDRVRLDKWLWAARFYKTRSLAAEAIAGGKVQVNGDRVKRAKPVQIGDEIRIRQGPTST